MELITAVMVERLLEKGMEITTIPAFIRDVANNLEPDSALNSRELDERMRLLGWDDFELDYHTLQLILAILEDDGALDPGVDGYLRAESLSKSNRHIETQLD